KQLAMSRTQQGFGIIAAQILGRVGEGINSADESLEEPSNPFLPNFLALYAVGNVLGSVLEDKDENDLFNVSSVLNAAALENLVRGGKENLAAARKWFFRVLAEADGDELLMAQTHERIAGVYHREKSYAQALNHYHQSIKLIERA